MESVLLVKDCDCKAPGATGQIWMTVDRTVEYVTMTSHYDPRMACTKCHKPWRAKPDGAASGTGEVES